MIAKITIHSDQIRWWVESALAAFDTLSHDEAIEHATAELTALLEYLEALDCEDNSLLIKLIGKPRSKEKVAIANDD